MGDVQLFEAVEVLKIFEDLGLSAETVKPVPLQPPKAPVPTSVIELPRQISPVTPVQSWKA